MTLPLNRAPVILYDMREPIKCCADCKVIQTDKNSNSRKRRDSIDFQSYCRKCFSIRNKKWEIRHPNRKGVVCDSFRARIVLLKSERPCYDCGSMFPPECMDFDHVFGKKLFVISAGSGKPWDTIREEIDKCQLVCSNCHRIRTKNKFWHSYKLKYD